MPLPADGQSIAVGPLSHDYHGRLKFELEDELHRQGHLKIIDSHPVTVGNEQETSHAQHPSSDLILSGTISRNELIGSKHHLEVLVTLSETHTRQVLWTTTWQNHLHLQASEREFTTTALKIYLAIAAGILIVFVRRESPRPEPVSD